MLVVKALLLSLVVTWISAAPSPDININVMINVNGEAAGDGKVDGKPGQDDGKDGCWNPVTEEMMPLWTTGYYLCEEQICMEDGEWKPLGNRLTECDDGGIFCVDYTSGAVLENGSVMNHNGFDYKCGDNDWEPTGPSMGVLPLPHLYNECWNLITEEMMPLSTTGYYLCEEQICMEDGEWKPTGNRLTECEDGGIFCMDYTNGAVLEHGSVMNHNGFDYKCGDNDWERTGPSTDASI